MRDIRSLWPSASVPIITSPSSSRSRSAMSRSRAMASSQAARRSALLDTIHDPIEPDFHVTMAGSRSRLAPAGRPPDHRPNGFRTRRSGDRVPARRRQPRGAGPRDGQGRGTPRCAGLGRSGRWRWQCRARPPEGIDALLEIWPVFEAFQTMYVAKGLILDAEKNVSAPSPTGPSAVATDTARALVQTAPQD